MNPETRTEARTETDLVIETTQVHAGLGALVSKAPNSANKVAVSHLGEDSATHARLVGTYTTTDAVTGAVETMPVDIAGTIEIGATETYSNGFMIPAAVKDLALFGMLGALRPAAQAKVMTILEARNDGTLAKADADAALLEAFNLSDAALAAGKAHLAARRTVKSTRAPKVRVSLDA